MSPKSFYVVDGSSYLYRAFYAIPDLKSPQGKPTNVIYGMVGMLQKLIKENRPDSLCVCYDLPDPTFRHKEFKEYKAQRKPTPTDLVAQIEPAKQVISAMGIEQMELKGYEADDLMASLALAGSKQGYEVILATGDKDILQLVSDTVKVLRINPVGQEIYDFEKIKEKYAVSPECLPDYLGLTGDASDNFPGVPGIGDKTAKNLLLEFGDLDNLYEKIHLVRNKRVRDILIENRELAFFSRSLATLKNDIEITKSIEDFSIKTPDYEKLTQYFVEYGFYNLLNELKSNDDHKSEDSEYKLDLDEIIPVTVNTCSSWCGASKIIGIAQYEDLIIGYNGDSFAQIEIANLSQLKCSDNKEKIWIWNAKPLCKRLLSANKELKLILNDLSIAALLAGHTQADSLGKLALELNRHNMIESAESIDSDKVKRNTAIQAYETFSLVEKIEQELIDKNLSDLFINIENPLVVLLAQFELSGIKVDVTLLRKLQQELQHEVNQLALKIMNTAGVEFNINSPKQLADILFEKLKLPTAKKTKTGFSTNVEVLESLRGVHPLPGMILDYRALYKILTTYVESYLSLTKPGHDIIHTKFDQMGANTGRIVSSEPNLQNLPVFSEWSNRIRQCFIPRTEDAYFLSADYSQIELRILAHISQDPGLIHAFKNDRDIHTETAVNVFKVMSEMVTSEMRRAAKAINFGIVYGMSAYGLSKSLKINVSEAQRYIDNYFEQYHGVRVYMDKVITEAREKGFVTTLMGRRCPILDIKSVKANIREAAERQAINAPIQGSAADLMKLAILKVAEALTRNQLESKILLTIHDELILEVPKNEIEVTKELLKENMERIVKLLVPVRVDISIGRSWAEC